MQARTVLPSSSLGYWRGTAGLSGPSAQGGTGMAQGTKGLSIGTGAVTVGGTSWHPSILYLLALTAGEMVVIAWLARRLG